MEQLLYLKKIHIDTMRANTMGNNAKNGNKNSFANLTGRDERLGKKDIFICVFPVLGSFITTIVMTLIANYISVQTLMARFDERITSINESLERIETNVTTIEDDTKALRERVGYLEGYLSANTIAIVPSDSFKNLVSSTYQSEESVYNNFTESLWEDSSMVIGFDKIKGRPYTASELENEIVILSYVDSDGSVVFFRGQFNENGRWDKECTINRYKNGNLLMIMDATYDDGKLIAYKQVMSTTINTNNENRNIWLVSSREVAENGNTGETWTYYRHEDIIQGFNTDSVQYEDIMRQDDFLLNADLELESYYYGNTSNGTYNDNTGDAYLVKYNPDGMVRFLYMGNFIDGLPHDTTGHAWSISFGYDKIHYYYYEGIFENGNHSGKLTQNDIVTVEQINEILKNETFNCTLQWYK